MFKKFKKSLFLILLFLFLNSSSTELILTAHVQSFLSVSVKQETKIAFLGNLKILKSFLKIESSSGACFIEEDKEINKQEIQYFEYPNIKVLTFLNSEFCLND